MINLFLKAARWKLLLFMFFIPFFIIRVIFRTLVNWDAPQNLTQFETFMSVFLLYLLYVLFMAAISAWYWSVAIGLRKEIPEHIRPSIKIFKIAYIVFFSYLTLILLSNIIGFFGTFEILFSIGLVLNTLLTPLIIAGYFYTVYFVAKTIKTAERQRTVKFKEFVGEFFLLLIYFIGIGFLQPKINKLANPEQESSLEEE